MIHNIHTMDIRTYGQLDQTEDLSLLRRWYNPFPVKWFDTDEFFLALRELFGEDTSRSISDESYKIISYNRILMLDRMLRTMSVLMRNTNERSLFSLLFKRDVNNDTGNLDIYVQKVKDITGIEVKDGDDLKLLQKEIQRRLDKYKELTPDKPIEVKSDFMDVVLAVFSIMEMAYTPDMKLSEFGRLKKLADKKNKPKDNGEHE